MFRNDWTLIESGYTAQEIEIARKVIGEDALAGIGYAQDYRVALRTVRATLRAVGTHA
jgi:hypothetical protein